MVLEAIRKWNLIYKNKHGGVYLSVWTKLQVSRNEGFVCLGTWRQEVSSVMG
jgi:hypothetical protein